MTATSEVQSVDRLAALEAEVRRLRIETDTLKRATFGDKSWYSSGYWWAHRDAEEAEHARERAKGEAFIGAADLSPEAVLAATEAAMVASSRASVQARDVAVRVFPEISPADAPGRQLLIARVGVVMRDLVADGKLERVSEPAGRRTSRYALAEAVTA